MVIVANLITSKKWELLIHTLSEEDVLYIQKLGATVEITEPETIKFGTIISVAHVITSAKIFIHTNCEQQELVLKLKYQDQLFLLSPIKPKFY
jgi:hypothetical protein